MKKFDNFKAALANLKDVFSYNEPYGNVEIAGMVGLYEICFEQSWKAMKEILENYGYAEGATGSPRAILKTAYKAGEACPFDNTNLSLFSSSFLLGLIFI